MEKQHTLSGCASASGIALHSGVRVGIRMLPAEPGSGIIFRRVDEPGAPEVRALASNVVDVRRGTAIAEGRGAVFTVEHILSALFAFEIDNCVVEMDGPEPPIFDGSALEFCKMIQRAGIKEQSASARIYSPSVPLWIDEGGSKVVILPGDRLRICCTTSFAGCPFDPQFIDFEMSAERYLNDIAPGRTFVDYRDLRMLLGMGLCRGGSLDAAAIINDGAIICKDKLRFKDEIVRHKVLDICGDLYLTGVRVRGTVLAVKPGHERNVALAGKMLAEIKTKNI